MVTPRFENAWDPCRRRCTREIRAPSCKPTKTGKLFVSRVFAFRVKLTAAVRGEQPFPRVDTVVAVQRVLFNRTRGRYKHYLIAAGRWNVFCIRARVGEFARVKRRVRRTGKRETRDTTSDVSLTRRYVRREKIIIYKIHVPQ